MTDLRSQLDARLRSAILAATGVADADPVLVPAAKVEFGDFQANGTMALAKKTGANPRALAEKILAALDRTGLISAAEVAGPGFINIKVEPVALAAATGALLADPRLGCPVAKAPQKVVVDYSSPNVAKEMHVGHLRSTVIGDALARVLAFQGHTVIRQNHVGDWGTQFGMLIAHIEDINAAQGNGNWRKMDITRLYQAAKKRDETEPDFAVRARRRVVDLQAGDPDALAIWKELYLMSEKHFAEAYARLQVLLTPDNIRGESAYNDMLPSVVGDLDAIGLLVLDKGARGVYVPGCVGKEDGLPRPTLVQKADGGYMYATTDLAAVRYRAMILGANRIVYVTDARQSDHFSEIFWIATAAKWALGVRLDHVAFGTVLGPDKKPFKTRSGDTIKLSDLIDEAESRATDIVREKNPSLAPDEQGAIGRAVGVGCLKYADLASDRVKDYVFDWNRMVSFEGNTAAYLQFSVARLRSILRKADPADLAGAALPAAAEERQLVLKIMQFPAVVDAVGLSLEPHRLCTWLYETATLAHKFAETCPVLKAEDAATRRSRLALCRLAADALATGLGLLGIQALDRM